MSLLGLGGIYLFFLQHFQTVCKDRGLRYYCALFSGRYFIVIIFKPIIRQMSNERSTWGGFIHGSCVIGKIFGGRDSFRGTAVTADKQPTGCRLVRLCWAGLAHFQTHPPISILTTMTKMKWRTFHQVIHSPVFLRVIIVCKVTAEFVLHTAHVF